MGSISSGEHNHSGDGSSYKPITFTPIDRKAEMPSMQLPDELWITVLESTCTFPQDVFNEVMLNLIKNPNITSSHLFRADIFYDSDSDRTGALLDQMKKQYQPVKAELPSFELQRTIVRQLVPRNPQLDRPLVQTCCFFNDGDDHGDRTIVLYIPHVQSAEEVPFYHPTVARLAFEHRSDLLGGFSISISYSLFPGQSVTTKLERTALKLLQTVHKHGQGQLAGYQKRVHHDRIVPQKRYQDTYTRLKTKYGKQLSEQWVEVTDPGKHVFEDLAIAAFLIELWRDTYSLQDSHNCKEVDQNNCKDAAKPKFPGFVDIGCGNGVLVYVLLSEGYDGWGFDARERKTWSIFPDPVQRRLQRRLLVPEIFTKDRDADDIWHNGVFQTGTFIISNHADELTAWTPLLAYLNVSAFIAIPCCSHDLAGARSRAPPTTKSAKARAERLPQQQAKTREITKTGAAETGSLKRTDVQKKMPSAYSTLCSYVSSLAEDVGFEPEHEVLRIPSTRNQCIIGRRKKKGQGEVDEQEKVTRDQRVTSVIERESGRVVTDLGADWIARAEKLAKKPGSGH